MPCRMEHAVSGSMLTGLLSAGPGLAQLAVNDMPPLPAPYAELVPADDASCWIVVGDPPRRTGEIFVNMLPDLGPPPPGGPVWADMPKMGTALQGWRDDAMPEQNAELARPASGAFLRCYEIMTGAN